MPFWDLKSVWGLAVFGVLLVLLSLLVSFRVDGYTLARRQRRGKSQLLNRAGPWARLVKFILAGVVIPVAALLAANLVELPGHETPMSLAIEMRSGSAPASQAEQLAAAVLHAPTQTVKIEGIRALRDMGSREALAQLLRILSEDAAALSDPGEAAALSNAIAAYGAAAGPPLVKLFSASSPAALREAKMPARDLFEQYLTPGFAGIEDEIKREEGEAASRAADLAKVEAAAAAARTALDSLSASASQHPYGADLPGFVLHTLQRADITQDPELLAFAARTAEDHASSPALRGQALLLIAKLGGTDDLASLYGYLGDPSPVVQACALRAIASLEIRLAPPRARE